MFKLALFSILIFFLAVGIFPGNVLAGAEETLLEIEFDEITIIHPNNWLGHGHLDEVFYLFPLEAEYEEFMANINFIIETRGENNEGEFWEEIIGSLEENLENFSLEKREDIKIDEQPGYKLVSTGYLPEIFPRKIKWLQVITFLNNERYLVITYTASKDSFPEYEEEALDIIFRTKIN